MALADHIGRAPIACRQTDTDRYGRIVAACTRGGEDLNARMVAQGWAVAYRQYALDYVAVEEVAKTAGRGIWSSRFDMPWNWRRQQRGGASGGACHIKGNVSSKGERIYHLPGGRWYETTRVDEQKGELHREGGQGRNTDVKGRGCATPLLHELNNRCRFSTSESRRHVR